MRVFHVFGAGFRDLIRLRLVHGVHCVAAEIWRSGAPTYRHAEPVAEISRPDPSFKAVKTIPAGKGGDCYIHFHQRTLTLLHS